MSPGQHRAYADLLPRYGVPYAPSLLDLKTHFGRTAPTILEIGSGMGETTASIAGAHPENNFLAVEVHTPGVASLLRQIDAGGLGNLRIIQHDAVEVLADMIPPDSLDGVHIFFPDPWPKKRHHKRRLVHPGFVRLLAARMKCGAYLHCATDWREYAEQMLEVLSKEHSLRNSAQGFAPRPAHRPLTKFEKRGLKLGHAVWDVIFLKT
jgi:tRNA (guanine-N7-)-methyltransferase